MLALALEGGAHRGDDDDDGGAEEQSTAGLANDIRYRGEKSAFRGQVPDSEAKAEPDQTHAPKQRNASGLGVAPGKETEEGDENDRTWNRHRENGRHGSFQPFVSALRRHALLAVVGQLVQFGQGVAGFGLELFDRIDAHDQAIELARQFFVATDGHDV